MFFFVIFTHPAALSKLLRIEVFIVGRSNPILSKICIEQILMLVGIRSDNYLLSNRSWKLAI